MAAQNIFEVNDYLQEISQQPIDNQLDGITDWQDVLITDIVSIRKQIKAAYEQGNKDHPRKTEWLDRVHAALRVKRYQLERLTEAAAGLRAVGNEVLYSR